MAELATKEITAQNTFTDAVHNEGYFNISIWNTFAATVTLQRSTDATNWRDVDSFTAPIETSGFDPEFLYYRLGVKTGDFTSGTVNVRIGGEDVEHH